MSSSIIKASYVSDRRLFVSEYPKNTAPRCNQPEYIYVVWYRAVVLKLNGTVDVIKKNYINVTMD